MNKNLYPPIRNYVLRQRRFTSAQRRALNKDWAQFGIAYQAKRLNLESIFNRKAPYILEIGFGNGESLLKQAIAAQEKNFIGIEVHAPGVAALILEAKKAKLSNLKIFQHDAIEVLRDCIPDEALSCIQIFFPDPWPKRRHHKRRLIQSNFTKLIEGKLKEGGHVHCATDWKHYAEQMMAVLTTSNLTNVADRNVFYPDAGRLRPTTKFEQRGLRLGYSVWDLLFVKSSSEN